MNTLQLLRRWVASEWLFGNKRVAATVFTVEVISLLTFITLTVFPSVWPRWIVCGQDDTIFWLYYLFYLLIPCIGGLRRIGLLPILVVPFGVGLSYWIFDVLVSIQSAAVTLGGPLLFILAVYAIGFGLRRLFTRFSGRPALAGFFVFIIVTSIPFGLFVLNMNDDTYTTTPFATFEGEYHPENRTAILQHDGGDTFQTNVRISVLVNGSSENIRLRANQTVTNGYWYASDKPSATVSQLQSDDRVAVSSVPEGATIGVRFSSAARCSDLEYALYSGTVSEDGELEPDY